MDTLLALDTQLFLFLNHLPHPIVLVRIMQFISGIGYAGIIWFAIGVVLFLREEKKDHRFFLPIVTAGALSWILAENFLKQLINRPRPTSLMGAWIFSPTLTDASFPSSHATIAWAMAVIFSVYEPKFRLWWYLLAVLISLSRIYLGVHYPSDVIGGALLGIILGCVGLKAATLQKKFKPHKWSHR